jgi:hypothetical protein
MVGVRGKGSAHETWTIKRPGFNTPDQNMGLYCEIHKKAGMVDVMSAIYCKKHKLPGIVPGREAKSELQRARSDQGLVLQRAPAGVVNGMYFARARASARYVATRSRSCGAPCGSAGPPSTP